MTGILIVNPATLGCLTLGILCDSTATAFMIMGSRHIPVTIHGLLGYSALLAMLAETIWVWTHWLRHGSQTAVTRTLHLYSRYAYAWWILAYIAGALIAAMEIKGW